MYFTPTLKILDHYNPKKEKRKTKSDRLTHSGEEALLRIRSTGGKKNMTLHNGIANFQQKVPTFLSWDQRSKNSDSDYKVKKNEKLLNYIKISEKRTK